jgi:hypothetical protein
MSPAKITKIEVQGFRAFHQIQSLDTDFPVTAIWGPNSQGKTSLAEAFEFLFSGKIVRRELMASSQDEFADALRNAHMPGRLPVFVRAHVVSSHGTPHVICRTLVSDYSKKQDCVSRFELDGTASPEDALRDLGFVLSHPPLSAPVLAQHTLGYLFSARPQERATYFRALLEVSDLEAFRAQVAALEVTLKSADNPILAKLTAATVIPAAAPNLKSCATGAPSSAAIAKALSGGVSALLRAEEITEPATDAEGLMALAELLVTKQSRTFPLKGFDRKQPAARIIQGSSYWARLNEYFTERAKVDRETRRLLRLFNEVLSLPAVAHAHDPIDCPVCGTEEGLTPSRIAAIRQSAADTDAFQQSEQKAIAALKELASALEGAETAIAAALPLFMQYPAKARRQRAFRVERIRMLLPQEDERTVAPWLTALRPFVRAQRKAAICIKEGRLVVEDFAAAPEKLAATGPVEQMIACVDSSISELLLTAKAYDATEGPLITAVKKAVDRESKTAGWQDLIDLASDPASLGKALVERAVLNDLQKEHQQALKEIDRGNETVLEEKFGELSNGVQKWWDLLRPGEHSFFSAVKPRPGARRSVDFKAGLADGDDRKEAKLRDVIAVFSQSQLHCLGLAVFLARAVHERSGFIVLDDPILSSDEDYRIHFKCAVMDELHKCGIRSVIITQCKDTWRDIYDLHEHRGAASYQISLSDPKVGAVIVKSSDEFEAMLTKAEPFTKSDSEEIRKIGGVKIREAAERFCKELLVKKAHEAGNVAAVVTDYKDKDGLRELAPLVIPYLEATDPSHRGKLQVLLRRNTNPANHDDTVPAKAALQTGLGVLREFRKRYLS